MSILDALTLGGVVALAVWWIGQGRRGPRWQILALLGVLALAGLQLSLEGWAWQFAPAHLCLLAIGLLCITKRWLGRPALAVARVIVAVGVVVSIAVWTFPRAPGLTPPDGPYP